MSSHPKKTWTRSKPTQMNYRKVHQFAGFSNYGYKAFHLYFTECEDVETTLKRVRLFEEYIRGNGNLFELQKIEQQSHFTVNYKLLQRDGKLSSLGVELENDAESWLKSFGLAMHQAISDFERTSHDQRSLSSIPVVRCRLINVEPVLQLKHLGVNTCNKLVAVRATVIKASSIKLSCSLMEFVCNNCKGTQIVKQNNRNYTVPTNCINKGCRAQSNFVPQLLSPRTKTFNHQLLRLQELQMDEQRESGRIPRTFDCELIEDQVGCCMPGDDVVVTGIVKMRNGSEDVQRNRQSSIFSLYMECVSVVSEKVNGRVNSFTESKISFDTSDYYAIQKIHATENLFPLLVHSLCPNIYGHKVVKAGLLLALFGGTQNSLGKRQDCHVLLVGDPGLGKSQLLQACCNVAPRGVYVCGNTSTGSGLTVTVTRESKGDYALEAGALILANQGICCIDEFDKMPTQHACLLEVMEQQCISIAKAGISRNLPTRVSVLAAANPAGGHYTKSKTVAENLKIGSPLLSRFDLIFILLDQPDERSDQLLSEHVLALHSSRKQPTSSKTRSSLNRSTLRESLSERDAEGADRLPHSLLRKYIAYAQRYVHPQLNEEAKRTLKQFYLELRQKYHSGDCTPITARQLESMQRLTQARAKLELREDATTEDALDVIEIMRHSLVDVLSDETGSLDFTRSPSGSGMSTRKQVIKFLNILQRRTEMSSTSLFHRRELQEVAEQAGVPREKFNATVESLNFTGRLLFKGANVYQLVSADF